MRLITKRDIEYMGYHAACVPCMMDQPCQITHLIMTSIVFIKLWNGEQLMIDNKYLVDHGSFYVIIQEAKA